MFLTKLFVLAVLCLLIYWMWQRRRYYMLSFQLPGLIGYPFIGSLYRLFDREALFETMGESIKRFGSVAYHWMATVPVLVLSEPEIIKDVLTSQCCVDKGLLYTPIDGAIGRGLFSLNGSEWYTHRKLLNPAFGPKVLHSFMPVFNEESDKLVQTFKSMINQGEVDIIDEIQRTTLNASAKTTMGKKLQSKSDEKDVLMGDYQFILERAMTMILLPWLKIKTIHKLYGGYERLITAQTKIHNFVKDLIDEKLAQIESQTHSNGSVKELEKETNLDNRNVFINLVIELLRNGYLKSHDVVAEANTLVFAAFETTANAVSYTLILLAMFPEYQQKAFEEILSVFPESTTINVTEQDIDQLPYLDMVVNEGMRLLTPVPFVAREVSQNDLHLSNGVVIPPGVQIIIDLFHMHRRKDIWGSDALTFNPDHFLPVNMENKHSYAFLPFTKGIRYCIGWRYALLSVKTMLIKVLRNYRLSTNFKFEDLQFREHITIKLKKVPLLEIHKR